MHMCLFFKWLSQLRACFIVSGIVNALSLDHDSVSERLRRWTRNPLGSARRGSNPLAVALAMHVILQHWRLFLHLIDGVILSRAKGGSNCNDVAGDQLEICEVRGKKSPPAKNINYGTHSPLPKLLGL